MEEHMSTYKLVLLLWCGWGVWERRHADEPSALSDWGIRLWLCDTLMLVFSQL